MFGGVILLIITGLASFSAIKKVAIDHPRIDVQLLKYTYWMHLLQTIVYYIYATFNPSDSHYYVEKILTNYRGPTWMDYYGTSTTFIEWLGYPLIRTFGFSYEAMMVLFSFLGFLGFLFFYIFFKENIRFKHKWAGFDLMYIVFLLPNLHFWSSSFGKGSIIFLGIGLVFFGLSNPGKRVVALLIGGMIVYHVRPHIMFVILASSAIGFTFSSSGISNSVRFGMIVLSAVSFFFIYQDVLTMVGIEQGEELNQGLDLTHRATELTKATSGVDITNYSMPMQVFTFLFRPLFIDAPGLLGLIVSFENVFYLLIAFKFLNLGGVRFFLKSNFLVKSAFFSFITVSIALAQIAGNLGIAIRQKSQVMILFLFVIMAYLDYKKASTMPKGKRRRRPQRPASQPVTSLH